MGSLVAMCIVFGCFITGTLSLPSKRGACVVMCSPGEGLFDDLGLSECRPDYTCQSTGCGAMCIPVYTDTGNADHGLSLGRRGVCAIQCSPHTGLYDDLNLPDCPHRSYCVSTGCGAICRPYI